MLLFLLQIFALCHSSGSLLAFFIILAVVTVKRVTCAPELPSATCATRATHNTHFLFTSSSSVIVIASPALRVSLIS